MPLHWYVLHTKPNAEYRVAHILEARGLEIFLPAVRSVHPRPGHETVPFFPSYLFARVDFTVTQLSTVQWTPGLRRIVAFDNIPAVVPDEAIEYIRAKVMEINGVGGLPSHGFKPGDEVRIRSGPLAGLRAIFEGPMGPAERVRVLIHFLGQVNRAEVPVHMLERVPESARQFREAGTGKKKRRRRTRGRGRRIRYKDRPAQKGASAQA